jgi:DHA1 family multidrug resistance protein-like MFS transporter
MKRGCEADQHIHRYSRRHTAASIADVFGNKPLIVPAAVGLYAIGAVLGPTLTPFIGGYAAMRFGWTAPNWILAGVAGFAFIVLFIFFPETHRPNVLYRRSRRLRRVTGNPKLVPRQAGSGKKLSVKETLWLPIGISLEPAPLLLGIYLGEPNAVGKNGQDRSKLIELCLCSQS